MVGMPFANAGFTPREAAQEGSSHPPLNTRPTSALASACTRRRCDREAEPDSRDIAVYLLTAAQPPGGAASSAQQPSAAAFFERCAGVLVFPLRRIQDSSKSCIAT